MAKSLDSVLEQMRAAGIDGLALRDLQSARLGKYHRFRPDGGKGKKKSAWFILFETQTKKGVTVYTGAFGEGPDTWRIEPDLEGLDMAARADLDRVHAQAKALAQREQDRARQEARAKAVKIWQRASTHGHSPYLVRKAVPGLGIRYGFNQSILVPMRDEVGVLWGLQFISAQKDDEGKDKIFLKGQRKEGLFHLIGNHQADDAAPDGERTAEIDESVPLVFAEGYATAVSVHLATGWQVVVCFDAGNVEPVAKSFRALYPNQQFIFAGDDDHALEPRLAKRLAKHGVPGPYQLDRAWHEVAGVRYRAGWGKGPEGVPRIELDLQQPGKPPLQIRFENAGRMAALRAARKTKGRALFPVFEQPDGQSDFNDLHCSQGLEAVKQHIMPPPVKAVPDQPGATPSPLDLRTLASDLRAMLREFVLIFPTNTVWMESRRKIVRLDDLRTFSRLVDDWLEHPDRRTVDKDNVVFDPSGRAKPPTHINLFRGFGLKPASSASYEACAPVLSILMHLCNYEQEVYDYVMRWFAYQLRHPGAKMQTALVFHGGEGTGKNLFFQSTMGQIFGEYALLIGQQQVEDQYNAFMSAKLYLVADEVVSRSEREHVKGRLKQWVAGLTINISEKYLPMRTEVNLTNFVFLSNELVPLRLDYGDRRYLVSFIQAPIAQEAYKQAAAWLADGGAAKLYALLLDDNLLPLEDFNEHTKPPINVAKQELIRLSAGPVYRFWLAWRDKELEVPYGPCTVDQLYMAFRIWSERTGERFTPSKDGGFSREIYRYAEVKEYRISLDLEMTGRRRTYRIFLINEPPEGALRSAWLRDELKTFQVELDRMKEMRHAA